MKCRSHLEFPEYWSCRVLAGALTCSGIAARVFWGFVFPQIASEPQSLATLLATQRAAVSNLWWVANSLTTAHSRPHFCVFGRRTSKSLCSTVHTAQMSGPPYQCAAEANGGCTSICFPKMQRVLVVGWAATIAIVFHPNSSTLTLHLRLSGNIFQKYLLGTENEGKWG